MDTTRITTPAGNSTRIGFLADTHYHPTGGPDLPAVVVDAFGGVDLIVHLGDMGEAAALDKLERVAPVIATRGGDDPPQDPRIAATRVIEVGGLTIGALFDLASAGIAGTEGGRLAFADKPLADGLRATFGRAVDVVAFGATHQDIVAHHDGVLFINPGSATLPAKRGASGLGTIAILDVRDRVATVELVRL